MATPTKYEALRLYKAILKLHKKTLPEDMRTLGNEYLRTEWKLHKNVSPKVARTFLDSWKEYFISLRSSSRTNEKVGLDLSEEQIKSLSKEQQEQLLKLKEETEKAFVDLDLSTNSTQKSS